jgi:osmotically-inducible protein OsmY
MRAKPHAAQAANLSHQKDTTIMTTANRSLAPRLLLALLLVGSGGVATLSGCASTDQQAGTGEYIDDTVITTKVKAAILNEPTLKVSEINVETFKGVVQLSGFVSSQGDINRAVAITRDIAGVQSVRNDMRVK